MCDTLRARSICGGRGLSECWFGDRASLCHGICGAVPEHRRCQGRSALGVRAGSDHGDSVTPQDSAHVYYRLGSPSLPFILCRNRRCFSRPSRPLVGGWTGQPPGAAFLALRQQVGGRPLAYLDSAATTPRPQTVINALTGFYATQRRSRGCQPLDVGCDNSREISCVRHAIVITHFTAS